MTPKLRNKSRAERTKELKQSIQDASLELFLAKGYEKTTTRQILQKVGILNGSLYNIYRSKEDIFTDISMRAITDSRAAFDEYIGEDSPTVEKLCFPICLQIYVTSRSERMAELMILTNENRDIREKIADRYIETYGEQRVPDDPKFRVMAAACTGALRNVLKMMFEDPGSVDAKAAARATCSMILAAFGHPVDAVSDSVERIFGILENRGVTLCGISI